MGDLKNYEGEYKHLYQDESSDTMSTWEFSQLFGEEENEDENGSDSDDSSMGNYISALAFDSTGRHLAVGYDAGQVVVLKQTDNNQMYQIYTAFKSHDVTFDFLTSVDIIGTINMIRWYPFPQRDTQRLLTTNDKTIKLFKLTQKVQGDDMLKGDVVVKPERIFEGGHYFNINAISFNSDGETFISSDDLRINLWNINVSDEALNTVDIKPDNMEELTEVITCSDFHPFDCNLLIYSSSKGIVRMGDLRAAPLCERQAKMFQALNSDVKAFFQNCISNISDVKFSPCGRLFCARDYLTVKVWDVRQESKPLNTIKFYEHINNLCELYESNAIFDHFEACWSYNSSQILTGAYNNTFYICNAFGDNRQQLRASKPSRTRNYQPKPVNDTTSIYKQKVLHNVWHPDGDLLALGAKDFGYLYQKRSMAPS